MELLNSKFCTIRNYGSIKFWCGYEIYLLYYIILRYKYTKIFTQIFKPVFFKR